MYLFDFTLIISLQKKDINEAVNVLNIKEKYFLSIKVIQFLKQRFFLINLVMSSLAFLGMDI